MKNTLSSRSSLVSSSSYHAWVKQRTMWRESRSSAASSYLSVLLRIRPLPLSKRRTSRTSSYSTPSCETSDADISEVNIYLENMRSHSSKSACSQATLRFCREYLDVHNARSDSSKLTSKLFYWYYTIVPWSLGTRIFRSARSRFAWTLHSLSTLCYTLGL